jgi:hypothetical protein
MLYRSLHHLFSPPQLLPAPHLANYNNWKHKLKKKPHVQVNRIMLAKVVEIGFLVFAMRKTGQKVIAVAAYQTVHPPYRGFQVPCPLFTQNPSHESIFAGDILLYNGPAQTFDAPVQSIREVRSIKQLEFFSNFAQTQNAGQPRALIVLKLQKV